MSIAVRPSAAPRRRRLWVAAGTAVLALALFGAGCSTVDYYAQSIQGHLAVMEAARPIPEVIADPQAPPPLKQRLERAQQIRRYASAELALPDNRSYTQYADLKRPYVVWNVFATPELSMTLKQWCYPIVGCAGYRGYFERDAAEQAAGELRAGGYEVHVSGVPAYSTLGWLPDPLLNTFIGGTEGQLAGLVFHELAHQVVFVGGDTTFNESFATAVEREGVRRWLQTYGNDASRQAYADFALAPGAVSPAAAEVPGAAAAELCERCQRCSEAGAQAAGLCRAQAGVRAAQEGLGRLRRLRPLLRPGPDECPSGGRRCLQRPGAGVRRAAGAVGRGFPEVLRRGQAYRGHAQGRARWRSAGLADGAQLTGPVAPGP